MADTLNQLLNQYGPQLAPMAAFLILMLSKDGDHYYLRVEDALSER